MLFAAFCVLILGSGSWGLTESSEARYAEISREMYTSHDYVHPRLLGIKHYHKPPMTYYITTLGYRLFGINEFGARFFLSIALMIQLILVFKIALMLFGDIKAAMASAIIYFSMPLVLVSSRVLTTDAYLTLFVLWAVYFLLRYWKEGKKLNLYAFYLLMGIGVLTKGPAMLLPVGVFFFTWKIIKRERLKITWHSVLAGSLFVIISGSWFALVAIQDPGVIRYFIGEQIIHRAVSAKSMNRDQPFWYYLLFAPLVGFPWIPIGLLMLIRRKRSEGGYRKEVQILGITAMLILLAFSVASSKLILYILPMFPFLALVSGYCYVQVTERMGRGIRLFFIGYGLFLAAIIGCVPLAGILGWNGALGSLLAILLLAGIFFISRTGNIEITEKSLLYSSMISFSLILAYAIFASHNPLMIRSFKPIMKTAIQGTEDEIDIFFVYDMMLPSAAFYLNKDVITLVDCHERVNRETQFEHGTAYKKYLIDLRNRNEREHMLPLLKGHNNAFLFQARDSVPDFLKPAIDSLPHRDQMGKYLLYY